MREGRGETKRKGGSTERNKVLSRGLHSGVSAWEGPEGHAIRLPRGFKFCYGKDQEPSGNLSGSRCSRGHKIHASGAAYRADTLCSECPGRESVREGEHGPGGGMLMPETG